MTIEELKQALADAEALLARETINADAGCVTAQQACFYALGEKQRIEGELQERYFDALGPRPASAILLKKLAQQGRW